MRSVARRCRWPPRPAQPLSDLSWASQGSRRYSALWGAQGVGRDAAAPLWPEDAQGLSAFPELQLLVSDAASLSQSERPSRAWLDGLLRVADVAASATGPGSKLTASALMLANNVSAAAGDSARGREVLLKLKLCAENLPGLDQGAVDDALARTLVFGPERAALEAPNPFNQCLLLAHQGEKLPPHAFQELLGLSEMAPALGSAGGPDGAPAPAPATAEALTTLGHRHPDLALAYARVLLAEDDKDSTTKAIDLCEAAAHVDDGARAGSGDPFTDINQRALQAVRLDAAETLKGLALCMLGRSYGPEMSAFAEGVLRPGVALLKARCATKESFARHAAEEGLLDAAQAFASLLGKDPRRHTEAKELRDLAQRLEGEGEMPARINPLLLDLPAWTL